jgi:biotin operon repressor
MAGIVKRDKETGEITKVQETETAQAEVKSNVTIDLSEEAIQKADKNQLIHMVKYLKAQVEEAKAKAAAQGPQRKGQVLELLKKQPMTIADIAKKLGISNANVSSQLTYLRKDGIKIFTDDQGQKFIPAA